MLKILLMILVSTVSIGLVSINLGYILHQNVLVQVTIVFILCILVYHYLFIWIPRALRKSLSLQLAVQIIYAAVDETILEPALKQQVKTKLNKSLRILGLVLDKNLHTIRNFNLIKIIRKSTLEEAWRHFFLDAFSLIEKEIADQTIQSWTFNKIRNKLNHDDSSRQVKIILQPFLKDSKFFYLVEQ